MAQGGGHRNLVVVNSSGTVITDATIEYNFLAYRDVPDNKQAIALRFSEALLEKSWVDNKLLLVFGPAPGCSVFLSYYVLGSIM